MTITLLIEIHLEGQWEPCATVRFDEEEKGIGSAAVLEYEIDYYSSLAAAARKRAIFDHRAVSVRYPLNLLQNAANRWPSFTLDLIPQGAVRRRKAAELNISTNHPSLDFALLVHGGGNPIGNLRIHESYCKEQVRLRDEKFVGVTFDDLISSSEVFAQVWEKVGTSAGGSEGIQGEWPKILMTRRKDKLWYPDSTVENDEGLEHVIVKRARDNSTDDALILESEAPYLELARAFGLNVASRLTWHNGTLIIPRFDRAVQAGNVVRFGQESLASAAGLTEFGIDTSHMTFIQTIANFSSDPESDIIEYIRRDVLNMACGNTDNHGRNTAFQKRPDGTIRLSPLFDFGPMRLVQGGQRTTTWRSITHDGSPDWNLICEAVEPFVPKQRLKSALKDCIVFLQDLPSLATDFGVPQPVITRAMVRRQETIDTLKAFK